MQTVHERLQFIQNNQGNLVQAAEMLKQEQHASPALHELLKVCFNSADSFSPVLGEGFPVEYTKDMTEPVGFSTSSLDKEAKRFYMFKQSYGLQEDKVKDLWLQLLESIHYTEADVLIFAKDKALGELYPFLDKLYLGD